MSAVFLIPLVALVVLRYLDDELAADAGSSCGSRRCLALELLVLDRGDLHPRPSRSLVALALGYALVPARRRRIVALLGPLASACGIAALLTAPFLYYALTGRPGKPVSPAGGLTRPTS